MPELTDLRDEQCTECGEMPRLRVLECSRGYFVGWECRCGDVCDVGVDPTIYGSYEAAERALKA